MFKLVSRQQGVTGEGPSLTSLMASVFLLKGPQALWEQDAQQLTFPEQRAEDNTHLSLGDKCVVREQCQCLAGTSHKQ